MQVYSHRQEAYYGYSRRPLGEPDPSTANLALAVVLLIVIGIQASFNAWQGMLLSIVKGILLKQNYRLLDRSCDGIHFRDATY